MTSKEMPRFDPRTVPETLIKKYHRSGPRYTSYPTAPLFSKKFSRETARKAWRTTAETPGTPLGLYIHLPFCRKRCLYCGCYTEIGHEESVLERYCDVLLEEAHQIQALIGNHRPVTLLSLGGGTPSHLPIHLMTRWVLKLKDIFNFTEDAELSIEINPADIDTTYLDSLLELGFTRFSFGLQDLDPDVQRAVKRHVSAEHLASLTEHLKESGIAGINIDLMYGLPKQTVASFASTVDTVIGLRPGRVAVFGYAHVPWIHAHQSALERYSLPTPKARTALFGTACDRLQDAGYIHIGMDHFALPDDPLALALQSRTLTRNFMGYTTWKGLDIVAMGASAISSVAGTYTQNIKDVGEYLNTRGIAWHKGLILTEDDILRREIILELFCNFHLDTQRISKRFRIDFDNTFRSELQGMSGFVSDGLVTLRPGTIEVTGVGRYFIRNICMVFDRYPDAGRYSKTI